MEVSDEETYLSKNIILFSLLLSIVPSTIQTQGDRTSPANQLFLSIQNDYTKLKHEFVKQNPDINHWKKDNPKAVLGLTIAVIVASACTVGISYVATKKSLTYLYLAAKFACCNSYNVAKFSCRKTRKLLTYLYRKARGDENR